jgi:hypothetical protein
LLEPLSEEEADVLIEQVGGADLSEATFRRITEASAGNPLFVEQMLAFRAQDGGSEDEFVVPPTIQALLAARIDRLNPEERAVIERASVEGRSFHRGAVSELLPPASRASLGGDLMSLVRKELIRPDRAEFAGDDGYRFVHALVQDAAYAAMAKELRGQLHEHLAAWLERKAGERRVEYEEILGYHLEQAYRYRAELGPVDDHARALARRAAEQLTAGAERALTRGDVPAHANLISRSLALLPREDAARLKLLPELGMSLTWLGDFAKAEVVLAEAITASSAAADGGAEARARIARAELGLSTGSVSVAELRQEAERAIQMLQKSGDDLGLARAWSSFAQAEGTLGHQVSAQEAWERSIDHARRSGSRSTELGGLAELAWAAVWGPAPRIDALRQCDQIMQEVKGHADFEGNTLAAVGCLRALEGRFDEARALNARRTETANELGLELWEAHGSYSAGWVELLADDAGAAERVLRPGYEKLAELGATGELQVVGSYLAQAICMQGRFEEAERLALSLERLDPTSVLEVASARCARAKAVAALGRTEEGERLAREAVALVDRTDSLIDRAQARMDLVQVLLIASRPDEAADLLDEALRLHNQKGNLVSAERTRILLAELGR